jgi:hypothetical protein
VHMPRLHHSHEVVAAAKQAIDDRYTTRVGAVAETAVALAVGIAKHEAAAEAKVE